MHSQDQLRAFQEFLGSSLSKWCLNSPTDGFFEKLNQEYSILRPDDYPRLRFNYVIANTAIVVIALNEYFQTAAPLTINPFQEIFLRESKKQHTVNVVVGDYVRSEKEITQLARIFSPPKIFLSLMFK